MRKTLIAFLMILAASVYSDEEMVIPAWVGINYLIPVGIYQIIGTTFRDDTTFVYRFKKTKKYDGIADIIILSTKHGDIAIDTINVPVDSGFVQVPIINWPAEYEP